MIYDDLVAEQKIRANEEKRLRLQREREMAEVHNPLVTLPHDMDDCPTCQRLNSQALRLAEILGVSEDA